MNDRVSTEKCLVLICLQKTVDDERAYKKVHRLNLPMNQLCATSVTSSDGLEIRVLSIKSIFASPPINALIVAIVLRMILVQYCN
jgi:hypothetical protein